VQRKLAERVTSSKVTWRSIKAAWGSERFFKAVNPAAAETLFVRHVSKLQQDEAEEQRRRAAEVRCEVLVTCVSAAAPGGRAPCRLWH
jgi:hypothetical protein